MAKIRSIKPQMWENEELARVSIGAHLLFVGLISHADDDGKQRGSARIVRSKVFPERQDVDEEHIEGWLWELVSAGFITLYGQPCGTRYVRVENWSKHQRKGSHYNRSSLPDPGSQYPKHEPPHLQARVPAGNPSALPEGTRTDSHRETRSKEGSKEGIGEEAAAGSGEAVREPASEPAEVDHVAAAVAAFGTVFQDDPAVWDDRIRGEMLRRPHIPAVAVADAAVEVSIRVGANELERKAAWSYFRNSLAGHAERVKAEAEHPRRRPGTNPAWGAAGRGPTHFEAMVEAEGYEYAVDYYRRTGRPLPEGLADHDEPSESAA